MEQLSQPCAATWAESREQGQHRYMADGLFQATIVNIVGPACLSAVNGYSQEPSLVRNCVLRIHRLLGSGGSYPCPSSMRPLFLLERALDLRGYTVHHPGLLTHRLGPCQSRVPDDRQPLYMTPVTGLFNGALVRGRRFVALSHLGDAISRFITRLRSAVIPKQAIERHLLCLRLVARLFCGHFIKRKTGPCYHAASVVSCESGLPL